MFIILVALWMAHLDWGLGLMQVLNQLGAAGAVPFGGGSPAHPPEILIRGQCVIGAGTLVLVPLMLIAPYIGLPEKIFTSPIKAVGGPGPEYVSVYLFTFDPASWTPRWQFYAPWSPFAAMLGIMMILFALGEKDRKWMMAGLLMILASKSRMGLVACTVAPHMMHLILQGWAWQVTAALTASLAVVGTSLITFGQNAVSTFKDAPTDSTRLREALQHIAQGRWQNEAVRFGHGSVHPGSHAVEYMPIGSHHTWFGLSALLVSLVWHVLYCMVDAARHPRGRLPMGILMTILVLSFGDNHEIQAYMLWPGLVVLGIHLRESAADTTRPAP